MAILHTCWLVQWHCLVKQCITLKLLTRLSCTYGYIVAHTRFNNDATVQGCYICAMTNSCAIQQYGEVATHVIVMTPCDKECIHHLHNREVMYKCRKI